MQLPGQTGSETVFGLTDQTEYQGDSGDNTSKGWKSFLQNGINRSASPDAWSLLF